MTKEKTDSLEGRILESRASPVRSQVVRVTPYNISILDELENAELTWNITVNRGFEHGKSFGYMLEYLQSALSYP